MSRFIVDETLKSFSLCVDGANRGKEEDPISSKISTSRNCQVAEETLEII